MNDAVRTCIVVADDPAVSGLVEMTASAGGGPLAVVVGRRAVADAVAAAGVRQVLWCGDLDPATPVEAYAPAVARLVTSVSPRLVVGAATVTGRALLGAVAAACQAPVLSGVTSVELDADGAVLTQDCYGGISTRTLAVTGGPAVLAVDPGTAAVAGAPVEVERVAAEPLGGCRVTERRTRQRVAVDLRSARTVVGVGRGLKEKADLALVEELATTLGGELACSRPLAEGVAWLAKERYLGISGQQISPELYLAIGISGQLQHMVGVRGARVVVAVNSDQNAPVFGLCDYGVVGDLYRVVPALVTALRG
jgi:electron transfer flavoprotein alpha subunit